jgi:pimeloyl-ACP methyl ester carboxylesterase
MNDGYRNLWIDNKGIKIHVLEANSLSNNGLTLLVAPGLWESAERYKKLFDRLDCRCIALSFRGRGMSDTPLYGYSFNHHVSDIEAVVDYLNLDNFCLLGFSKGVVYAIGYMKKFHYKIIGLILIEQPPINIKWTNEKFLNWLNYKFQKTSIMKYIRLEALKGIRDEGEYIDMWKDLKKIACPVILMRGISHKTEVPSDVSDDIVLRFKKIIKHIRIINFKESGHMILDDEPELLASHVKNFINSLKNS